MAWSPGDAVFGAGVGGEEAHQALAGEQLDDENEKTMACPPTWGIFGYQGARMPGGLPTFYVACVSRFDVPANRGTERWAC